MKNVFSTLMIAAAITAFSPLAHAGLAESETSPRYGSAATYNDKDGVNLPHYGSAATYNDKDGVHLLRYKYRSFRSFYQNLQKRIDAAQ